MCIRDSLCTVRISSWFPPVSFHTFSTTLYHLIPARPFVTFSHTALSAMAGNLFFGLLLTLCCHFDILTSLFVSSGYILTYANPIPSFRFWSGRKNHSCLCEIECGDGGGVICLFARVIQRLGFWTQKFQANVDYCYVCPAPRRVHFARPWTQASKPALTSSSLAAKRRAEALHVIFFSAKHQSQAR